MSTQYETSLQHQQNIESGMKVIWTRWNGEEDDEAVSVVAYDDGSRWLFDNGSAEELTLIGKISDGLGKAEVLRTRADSIVALYDTLEMYPDAREWVASMPESDREEAAALLDSRIPSNPAPSLQIITNKDTATLSEWVAAVVRVPRDEDGDLIDESAEIVARFLTVKEAADWADSNEPA